jgi:toxin ParE1/3/4
MAERKIVMTPKAEEDLRAIFDYLSDFSLNAADIQVGKILDKIDLLLTFPRIGRVLPDFKNDLLRELLIGDYLVAYYIVSESQIDILTIHHSSSPRIQF